MRETEILIRESHPSFSYIFKRDGLISKMLGRRFRYVCYLYLPNELRAHKIERGFKKTEEAALEEIKNVESFWERQWNVLGYWDKVNDSNLGS